MAQSPTSAMISLQKQFPKIHDLRYRHNPEDILKLVFEGDLKYGSADVHVIVTHHIDFQCLELILFPLQSGLELNSAAEAEVNNCEIIPWGRYFLFDEPIFHRIAKSDFERALETEKLNCRQHHRHYSFTYMVLHAKYRASKQIIQEILTDIINYDISRRYLEMQTRTSQIILDPIGRPLEYRSYFASNLALLMLKPPCLVVTNLAAKDVEKAFAEYQKKLKMRPLFTIAAKRLVCNWAKLFSSPAQSSANHHIHLPQLFPSHADYTRNRLSQQQLREEQQLLKEKNNVEYRQHQEKENTATSTSSLPSLPAISLRAAGSVANSEADSNQDSNNLPSDSQRHHFIGTRVSIFLFNAAMQHHSASSQATSPCPSQKIDDSYCLHHQPCHLLEETISEHQKMLLSTVSVARVRWIVAIDRTIRNLLHQRIVLFLQQLQEKERLKIAALAANEQSHSRTRDNFHNINSNSNSKDNETARPLIGVQSRMHKLRTRVMAVAALSRLQVHHSPTSSDTASSSSSSSSLSSSPPVAVSPTPCAQKRSLSPSPSTGTSSNSNSNSSSNNSSSSVSPAAMSPMGNHTPATTTIPSSPTISSTTSPAVKRSAVHSSASTSTVKSPATTTTAAVRSPPADWMKRSPSVRNNSNRTLRSPSSTGESPTTPHRPNTAAVHLPPISLTTTAANQASPTENSSSSILQNSSSLAAMQQLRGAWLHHRQKTHNHLPINTAD